MRRQKSYAVLLILVMTLTLIGLTACKPDSDGTLLKGDSAGGLVFTLNGDGESYSVSVDTEEKVKGSLTIPSVYRNKPVTGIKNSAFSGCSELTEIVIPNSVTSIGRNAFNNCYGLTDITIPTSVSEIESSAFSGCNRLIIYCFVENKPSNWNSNWCKIDSFNFCPVVWDCNNNEKASNGIIYASIGGIRYGLEESADSVKTAKIATQSCAVIDGIVGIPSSVSYKNETYSVIGIDNYAFRNCDGLTGIVIPDSVTSIGAYAFFGCGSLVEMTLPFIGEKLNGTVNTHFGYIFGANSYNNNPRYVPDSLKSVIITSENTLAAFSFFDLGNLESVVISDSVTVINSRVFSGCDNLTIKCRAAGKPNDWANDWNPDNRPVIWGYAD